MEQVNIIAFAAVHKIFSCSSVNHIITVTTIDIVLSCAAKNHIIATRYKQLIISAIAKYIFSVICPDNTVTAHTACYNTFIRIYHVVIVIRTGQIGIFTVGHMFFH